MKMTPFQLILTGIFAVLILLGVGIFATQNSSSGGGPVGPVTVWGTADADTMEALLATLRQGDKVSFESVVYVEKNPSTFTSELVNAMATGSGPDLFLVSDADVSTFADKITPIPYSAVSQRDFTDAFIDEGQLFLTTQGALALPFSVDPWIMYWNRDLFASAGVAKPPAYWNDFLDMAPRLTSLDASGNIKKSAVALGEWSNVVGAKNIIALLLLQAGDAIVVRGETGALISVLGRTPEGAQENPAASALQFYTEFANPSKTIYSWNRSLPNSQNSFVAGDLAVYLGPASDYSTIANRNPNLHFSVALVPQIEGNAVKLTFGRLTGVAISRTANNPNGGLVVAQKLTSAAGISALAQRSSLPPVRRDVSVNTSDSAARSVFTQSALIARSWLDPNPAQTNEIFSTMIQSVVSGKSQPSGAVFNAAQLLQTLLRNNGTQ